MTTTPIDCFTVSFDGSISPSDLIRLLRLSIRRLETFLCSRKISTISDGNDFLDNHLRPLESIEFFNHLTVLVAAIDLQILIFHPAWKPQPCEMATVLPIEEDIKISLRSFVPNGFTDIILHRKKHEIHLAYWKNIYYILVAF